MSEVEEVAARINAVVEEIEATKSKRQEANDAAKAALNEGREAVDKLDKLMLDQAYEAGALGHQLKKLVGHGNFGKMVKLYCAKSYRSVNDYMELVEWRERIEEANSQQGGGAANSIRAAKAILEKLKRAAKGLPPKETKKKTEPQAPASPDLKDLLKNVDADEVRVALKDVGWSEAQLGTFGAEDEAILVLKTKGEWVEPEKIANSLKEVLPIADLRELARYIDELLLETMRPTEPAPEEGKKPERRV
jgi:hypothetical protein